MMRVRGHVEEERVSGDKEVGGRASWASLATSREHQQSSQMLPQSQERALWDWKCFKGFRAQSKEPTVGPARDAGVRGN